MIHDCWQKKIKSGRPGSTRRRPAWEAKNAAARKATESIAAHLGDNELAVLTLVADRLRLERRAHGELHLNR